MASTTILAFAAILLVASLCFISPSYGITKDILATICSQTQNQETCENILLSDPRTSSADLPLLSVISLELTIKQAANNFNNFTQLRDNTTDHALKSSYESCVKIYQDIKGKVQVDYQLSQKKQYKNITDLGQLTTLAYNCENGLPSNSPTAAITEDMLLTSETAIFVNEYVAS